MKKDLKQNPAGQSPKQMETTESPELDVSKIRGEANFLQVFAINFIEQGKPNYRSLPPKTQVCRALRQRIRVAVLPDVDRMNGLVLGPFA